MKNNKPKFKVGEIVKSTLGTGTILVVTGFDGRSSTFSGIVIRHSETSKWLVGNASARWERAYFEKYYHNFDHELKDDQKFRITLTAYELEELVDKQIITPTQRKEIQSHISNKYLPEK